MRPLNRILNNMAEMVTWWPSTMKLKLIWHAIKHCHWGRGQFPLCTHIWTPLKTIVRIENDLAEIVTIWPSIKIAKIIWSIDKHGRQAARLSVTYHEYDNPIFLHFMCFSSIILSIAKCLHHIRLFKTVTVNSKIIFTLLSYKLSTLIICHTISDI